ncbi:MAG: hypothetical protein ACLU3U_10455, partial [Gallintestinimicrobium sp.]
YRRELDLDRAVCRVQDVLAEKITEKLERAMAREYGELLAEHEKDYREFYDRVALSLPEKEKMPRFRPTSVCRGS